MGYHGVYFWLWSIIRYYSSRLFKAMDCYKFKLSQPVRLPLDKGEAEGVKWDGARAIMALRSCADNSWDAFTDSEAE